MKRNEINESRSPKTEPTTEPESEPEPESEYEYEKVAEMGHLLLEFIETLDASFQRELRAATADVSDLTAGRFRYIDAVHALDRPTISEVADALGVSRASATAAIASLEDAGYLRKVPSQTDGRVVHVVLTPDGRRPIHAKWAAIEAYEDVLDDVLTDDELRAFETIMTKLVRRFAETDSDPSATPNSTRDSADTVDAGTEMLE